MSKDSDVPAAAGDPADGAGRRRARRVSTSIAGRPPRGGKRKLVRPRHTVAKVIVATLLALALATGVSVVLVYNHWNGNLNQKSLAGQLKNRPDKQGSDGPQEPLNILVMGSDTREGEGNNIDGMTLSGERSDTTLLIHLSANRKFAYGISIPRDTLVDRPECYEEDGTPIPAAQDVMWNDAFSVGGPACTIQQFEQISGVRVDNYAVIDFRGFKDMVNALDGVEVCIPEDIVDTERGITLEAGTREIKDEEALSYVRVRYTVGDGTDPNRIRRQQAFMAAMMSKVVRADMLARPDRIVGFMNALTDSIQTDFANIAQLAKIGGTFQGIGLHKVKFVTTPWEYSTTQEGRVEWTPEVDDLWDLVVEDEPLSEEFVEDSISAADDPQGGASEDPSASSDDPTEDSSESGGGGGDGENGGGGGGNNGGSPDDGGLSEDERASAGLCT